MKKNILIFIVCLFIAGVISISLGLDRTWDLYSYHYYNAYAVLNNQLGYDLMPAGIQSYLNPVLDIIDYYIINSLKYYNYNIILFVSGFPYGCLIFILYLINNKLFSKISDNNNINNVLILFATIIGASESFVLSETGTAYHDINTGIFILLAILFILNYFETDNVKNLCFAGFFAGIAGGLKLTVLIYFPALLIAFFIINIKTNLKKLLYNLILLGFFGFLGFMLVDGYWMYVLWQKFHNPVFPMYNGIFKSDWFTHVNYHDTRYTNISIIKVLFYPLIWSDLPPNQVAELEFFDYRHALAYISVLYVPILFILRNRFKNAISQIDKKSLFMIIFIIISYLIWIKSFGILRYLIPVLVLSGTVLTIFLSQLRIIISNKKNLSIALTALTIIAFIGYEIPSWGREDFLIQPPKIPIKKDSVVLIYGKPLAFYAARKYKGVRFIYLYDNIDGTDDNFTPSKKYYNKIDEIIKNKKKYIIMTHYELYKDDDFHNFIKDKYINTELKCSTHKLFYWTYVDLCEYVD